MEKRLDWADDVEEELPPGSPAYDGKYNMSDRWHAGLDVSRGQSRQRLDMSHGFVKHIVKNQVNRDEYEQQWQAAMKDADPYQQKWGRAKVPEPGKPRRRWDEADAEPAPASEADRKNWWRRPVDPSASSEPVEILPRRPAKSALDDDLQLPNSLSDAPFLAPAPKPSPESRPPAAAAAATVTQNAGTSKHRLAGTTNQKSPLAANPGTATAGAAEQSSAVPPGLASATAAAKAAPIGGHPPPRQTPALFSAALAAVSKPQSSERKPRGSAGGNDGKKPAPRSGNPFAPAAGPEPDAPAAAMAAVSRDPARAGSGVPASAAGSAMRGTPAATEPVAAAAAGPVGQQLGEWSPAAAAAAVAGQQPAGWDPAAAAAAAAYYAQQQAAYYAQQYYAAAAAAAAAKGEVLADPAVVAAGSQGMLQYGAATAAQMYYAHLQAAAQAPMNYAPPVSPAPEDGGAHLSESGSSSSAPRRGERVRFGFAAYRPPSSLGKPSALEHERGQAESSSAAAAPTPQPQPRSARPVSVPPAIDPSSQEPWVSPGLETPPGPAKARRQPQPQHQQQPLQSTATPHAATPPPRSPARGGPEDSAASEDMEGGDPGDDPHQKRPRARRRKKQLIAALPPDESIFHEVELGAELGGVGSAGIKSGGRGSGAAPASGPLAPALQLSGKQPPGLAAGPASQGRLGSREPTVPESEPDRAFLDATSAGKGRRRKSGGLGEAAAIGPANGGSGRGGARGESQNGRLPAPASSSAQEASGRAVEPQGRRKADQGGARSLGDEAASVPTREPPLSSRGTSKAEALEGDASGPLGDSASREQGRERSWRRARAEGSTGMEAVPRKPAPQSKAMLAGLLMAASGQRKPGPAKAAKASPEDGNGAADSTTRSEGGRRSRHTTMGPTPQAAGVAACDFHGETEQRLAGTDGGGNNASLKPASAIERGRNGTKIRPTPASAAAASSPDPPAVSEVTGPLPPPLPPGLTPPKWAAGASKGSAAAPSRPLALEPPHRVPPKEPLDSLLERVESAELSAPALPPGLLPPGAASGHGAGGMPRAPAFAESLADVPAGVAGAGSASETTKLPKQDAAALEMAAPSAAAAAPANVADPLEAQPAAADSAGSAEGDPPAVASEVAEAAAGLSVAEDATEAAVAQAQQPGGLALEPAKEGEEDGSATLEPSDEAAAALSPAGAAVLKAAAEAPAHESGQLAAFPPAAEGSLEPAETAGDPLQVVTGTSPENTAGDASSGALQCQLAGVGSADAGSPALGRQQEGASSYDLDVPILCDPHASSSGATLPPTTFEAALRAFQQLESGIAADPQLARSMQAGENAELKGAAGWAASGEAAVSRAEQASPVLHAGSDGDAPAGVTAAAQDNTEQHANEGDAAAGQRDSGSVSSRDSTPILMPGSTAGSSSAGSGSDKASGGEVGGAMVVGSGRVTEVPEAAVPELVSSSSGGGEGASSDDGEGDRELKAQGSPEETATSPPASAQPQQPAGATVDSPLVKPAVASAAEEHSAPPRSFPEAVSDASASPQGPPVALPSDGDSGGKTVPSNCSEGPQKAHPAADVREPDAAQLDGAVDMPIPVAIGNFSSEAASARPEEATSVRPELGQGSESARQVEADGAGMLVGGAAALDGSAERELGGTSGFSQGSVSESGSDTSSQAGARVAEQRGGLFGRFARMLGGGGA